ncbi:hypothetical protein EYF80_021629 [Liparis tanakae]|uniref:Uncharacterized protein n=1 Tax=Liparis tanakae TaxID=230148 RepID=A0A4Z2HQM7_9TELE|nr:hypothetical protein EYF80_021629 [Liparis tanakae]
MAKRAKDVESLQGHADGSQLTIQSLQAVLQGHLRREEEQEIVKQSLGLSRRVESRLREKRRRVLAGFLRLGSGTDSLILPAQLGVSLRGVHAWRGRKAESLMKEQFPRLPVRLKPASLLNRLFVSPLHEPDGGPLIADPCGDDADVMSCIRALITGVREQEPSLRAASRWLCSCCRC